jgi:hypothetical protein
MFLDDVDHFLDFQKSCGYLEPPGDDASTFGNIRSADGA